MSNIIFSTYHPKNPPKSSTLHQVHHPTLLQVPSPKKKWIDILHKFTANKKRKKGK